MVETNSPQGYARACGWCQRLMGSSVFGFCPFLSFVLAFVLFLIHPCFLCCPFPVASCLSTLAHGRTETAMFCYYRSHAVSSFSTTVIRLPRRLEIGEPSYSKVNYEHSISHHANEISSRTKTSTTSRA